MKRFSMVICTGAAVLLASCEQGPSTSARATPPAAGAALAVNLEGSGGRSALNDFADDSAPTGPPSYEVAIASAAADENQALEACGEKPPARRNSCRKLARAAWDKAAAAARSIRGKSQE